MSRDIKTLPISRIAVSKLLKAGYSTADFLQYVDKANLEKGRLVRNYTYYYTYIEFWDYTL